MNNEVYDEKPKGYCSGCVHYENEDSPCIWNYLYDDDDEPFECCDWDRKQQTINEKTLN